MSLIAGYETWSELELLTGLIIGEARGEGMAGRIGVALTARTRAKKPCWWGKNLREVILMDRQFSCWQDHNADVIRSIREQHGTSWKNFERIAMDVYSGITIDCIGKPTHYHTINCNPKWAGQLKYLTTIGKHKFYHDPRIDEVI
jgi:N-acetylmuramoyl-L-alanine amidase